MTLTISRRCASIAPSATLAIDARAKALKAAGERVVGFGAGEPDFPTPEYICDAAREAIAKGMTRYTPASGTPELRQAICRKLSDDNGLSYKPDQIIVCNGAKQALLGAFLAVLNPGDEVLLPSPCWVSYPEMIRMADGVPVYVPGRAEDGFLPTLDEIDARVTAKTKAILVNSPSNPTGCVYPEALLRGIAELAVARGLYVISDEIYEKLIYGGHRHISIASFGEAICEQTIVINGMSKTYAMTGWRIGYAAGPKALIAAMGAYQSHATSNPNSIAQHASVAALRDGEAIISAMRDEFDARRRHMVERIRRIEGLGCVEPFGAFYVMMDVRGVLGRAFGGKAIDSAMAFSAVLLDEAKVAVVPGEPFEAPGYCRLSYAVSRADIDAGLDAIEAFVRALE